MSRLPLSPEQVEWLRQRGHGENQSPGGFVWRECPHDMARIQVKGYASSPGSGPAGKCCGDCQHAARFGRYAKCELVKASWTCTRRTDILLRAPSCSLFEPKVAEEARV